LMPQRLQRKRKWTPRQAPTSSFARSTIPVAKRANNFQNQTTSWHDVALTQAQRQCDAIAQHLSFLRSANVIEFFSFHSHAFIIYELEYLCCLGTINLHKLRPAQCPLTPAVIQP